MDKKVIIIAAVVIVLLIISGVSAYMILKDDKVNSSGATVTGGSVSSTFPALVASNMSTPMNTSAGGSSVYLDRHDVMCPPKSGMSRFKLNTGTEQNMQTEYSCLGGTDFGDAVPTTTPVNDWGGGNTIYLDRHAVTCPSGSVINRWHLARPAADKIAIEYNCSSVPGLNSCEDKSTEWNEEGGGNVAFLNRHDVKCPANKMLSKWQLQRKGDNNYRIGYTCCGR